MTLTRDEILNAWIHARDFPLLERERQSRNGYQIFNPLLAPAIFSATEWTADSFIAMKGMECVISCISACEPRTGAWRRLVNSLLRNGYTIRVECPLGGMEQALIKTGFQGPFRHEGGWLETFDYWVRKP